MPLIALLEGTPSADAVRRVRRRVGSLPVAGHLSSEGPFEESGLDVLLSPASGDASQAANHAMAGAVRAGGRPLLLDVRIPGLDPELLVAGIDAGAAGALVRTGDRHADRRLVAELASLEARRLDRAPLVSVVVCNHNNGRYLDECLGSLENLAYPRYEVIVCDDGSSDDSREIARRYPVELLELEHGGLSRARNAGIEAASGGIVAFLDADAAAEPGWLSAVWRLMDRTGAEAAGGPNLPFPGTGWRERAVAGAPGPTLPIVYPDGSCLFSPGCNLAVRRDAIERVGGFDPSLVASYDDVELLRRLIGGGARLSYVARGSVLHHRRDHLTAFLRQQRAYAASESANDEHGRAFRLDAPPSRTLRQRLDPRRPRYVFAGPQGRQVHMLATQPLHVDLPLKALMALLAIAAAGAPVATRAGRLGVWTSASSAALCGLVAVVAGRAQGPPSLPGWRGKLQRIATVALWFAQPLVRKVGLAQGRRPH